MTTPESGRHLLLEKMRSERPVLAISDLAVKAALNEIAATGVLPILEQITIAHLGRRRLLTVEGLWTGMLLCSAENRGQVRFDKVTDILHQRIGAAWRARFGIPDRPDDDRGFEAGYAVVRRLLHKILKALDPSPLPKNLRLPKEQAAQLLADVDEHEAERRRSLLRTLSNSVLEGSVIRVRDLLAQHWDGSVSVDGTAVATFAKGLRSTGLELATDPDAGWYVRDGDHRDDEGALDNLMRPDRKPESKDAPGRRKRRRKKYVFGYEATLVVARDTDPSRQSSVFRPPALVLALTMDRPGREPGKRATEALADAFLRRGYTRGGYIGPDRAYNNSDPGDFQLPVRAMGLRPVFDYRLDQLGIAAGVHGAIQIEGTWYSPAMPQPLIDATADLLAGRIDKATWKRRIKARAPYALVPKEHPDQEGFQRFLCPAAAGKLQCPIKPASLRRGHSIPLADPEPSPVGLPKICAQASITIAPELGAKHAQSLPYGSDEWVRIYFTLRNSIESFNGYAKDDNYEAIERGGRRRIRGMAAQMLLLAFQLHHANTRKIDAWLDTLPAGSASRPRRRPPRRRENRPLSNWTPTGYMNDEDLPQAA
ncbi:hypothetical protein ABH920_000313 [Catenulispora sp. EB89]|uniref:hypothetical protein n=1 Tax=Catenulispora sp. EB89 TaxID=3156257 RepID=UPI003515BAB3